MICVSIGRGRHKMMLAEHKHVAEQGAQLVELRLDYLRTPADLKRLLADRPCPVIITCRRTQDGGLWYKSEDERLMLLRQAIASGVEWVDLEEDTAAKIPRFGRTKRIVSYHNFEETPKDLEAIHERLSKQNADVVKIATMAKEPHDNLRMLELVRKASKKVQTVGLCMGDIGMPSRILAGMFDAPWTYATFNESRELAPGQLSFQQMVDIYHYDRIHDDTEVFGVVADPVGHSLSPIIHNAAFRQCAMNRVYVPFRVPAEHLASFLTDAPKLGVKGLSVTIPHKEAAMKLLTHLDPSARAVGAVNTIVWDKSEATGYNTDYPAAIDSLEAALGGLGATPSPVTGKVALVLGAGGAAKAVAHVLHDKGAEVVISNRTSERAQKLAEEEGCGAADWTDRYGVDPDILVNCTPIGMHPNVEQTPYDKHSLKPALVVFDTVYNPENTLLIKQARDQSCTVVTGVEMFIRQASMQFKLFTSREAPAQHMRETLKRATSAAKY
jgi:3-dehydroquinate dehydratase/shikimate dehydrogenase